MGKSIIKTIKIFAITNCILLSNCLGQIGSGSLEDLAFKDYETGTLKDGYKEGIWEYYDNPSELSLKVNYDNGQLLYLIPDTSAYAIKINNEWVYSKLDMQPRYIGSMVEFYKILYTNIQYPNEAKSNSTAGQFYITFEIDTLGHSANFIALNDIGDNCSEEIIRAIKLIPNFWLSATKDKIKYVAKFILPIKFEMEVDGKAIAARKRKGASELLLPPAKSLETIKIKVAGFTREDTKYLTR